MSVCVCVLKSVQRRERECDREMERVFVRVYEIMEDAVCEKEIDKKCVCEREDQWLFSRQDRFWPMKA